MMHAMHPLAATQPYGAAMHQRPTQPMDPRMYQSHAQARPAYAAGMQGAAGYNARSSPALQNRAPHHVQHGVNSRGYYDRATQPDRTGPKSAMKEFQAQQDYHNQMQRNDRGRDITPTPVRRAMEQKPRLSEMRQTGNFQFQGSRGQHQQDFPISQDLPTAASIGAGIDHYGLGKSLSQRRQEDARRSQTPPPSFGAPLNYQSPDMRSRTPPPPSSQDRMPLYQTQPIQADRRSRTPPASYRSLCPNIHELPEEHKKFSAAAAEELENPSMLKPKNLDVSSGSQPILPPPASPIMIGERIVSRGYQPPSTPPAPYGPTAQTPPAPYGPAAQNGYSGYSSAPVPDAVLHAQRIDAALDMHIERERRKSPKRAAAPPQVTPPLTPYSQSRIHSIEEIDPHYGLRDVVHNPGGVPLNLQGPANVEHLQNGNPYSHQQLLFGYLTRVPHPHTNQYHRNGLVQVIEPPRSHPLEPTQDTDIEGWGMAVTDDQGEGNMQEHGYSQADLIDKSLQIHTERHLVYFKIHGWSLQMWITAEDKVKGHMGIPGSRPVTWWDLKKAFDVRCSFEANDIYCQYHLKIRMHENQGNLGGKMVIAFALKEDQQRWAKVLRVLISCKYLNQIKSLDTMQGKRERVQLMCEVASSIRAGKWKQQDLHKLFCAYDIDRDNDLELGELMLFVMELEGVLRHTYAQQLQMYRNQQMIKQGMEQSWKQKKQMQLHDDPEALAALDLTVHGSSGHGMMDRLVLHAMEMREICDRDVNGKVVPQEFIQGAPIYLQSVISKSGLKEYAGVRLEENKDFSDLPDAPGSGCLQQ